MNITKYRLAQSLGALLLLASCGGGGSDSGSSGNPPPVTIVPIDPATVTFEKHYQPEANIALVYPQTWSRDDAFADPQILMSFAEPLVGADDPLRENVLLVRVDTDADLTSPDVINIREVSSRAVQIAGLAGVEEIIDANIVGSTLDLRVMQLAFDFEGSTYGLLYTAERDDFERNSEIVRYMASQIVFGQNVITDLNLTSDLTSPGKPAIASDNEKFLLVSCRESTDFPYPAELVGRIVNADRSMGDEFQIQAMVDTGNTGCEFTSYRAAFDGTNYLVAYMTNVEGSGRSIVAKRIGPAGQLVDSEPMVIAGDPNMSHFAPSIAFDGSRTFVVWHTRGTMDTIDGAFVSADGTVSAPVRIAENLNAIYSDPNIFVYTPQVAYGDNQFMVIWQPYRTSASTQEDLSIYGQLVDLSGSVLLPQSITVRADDGDNPRFATIASNGSEYVVGWVEGLLVPFPDSDRSYSVYARQINAAGSINDADGNDTLTIVAPPTANDRDSDVEAPKAYLDLTFNDDAYVFLWSSSSNDPTSGVYGARVSPDLSQISTAVPVAGLDRDTYRSDLPMPSHPAAGYSATQTLAAWPLRNGTVVGWFIDEQALIGGTQFAAF